MVSVQLERRERRAVALLIRRSWVRAPPTPPDLTQILGRIVAWIVGRYGINSILSGAFEAAMRWEWTDRNPARSAKPPTLSRQTILATSPESVAKVIAAARAYNDALGLYLWLVVVTGVRRGELCGLQIHNVDLDRGLVHVAFNYVVRAGQRILKDTKTHPERWLSTRSPAR